MKLQPTSNHVLVEATAEETQSAGGIVLPQGIELKSYETSAVVAVGPEVNRLSNGEMGPEIIKEGGMAVYAKDDYVVIEVGGNKYRVISSHRICAVINGGYTKETTVTHIAPNIVEVEKALREN